MGWSFCNAWNKAGLVKHLTEENGLPTLAKSVRGNTLWTVQEGTKTDGTKERFIGCYRLQGGRHEGWGYKDMDESMGPCYYDCPLKFFDMVPCPEYGYAKEWREKVRAFHAAKAAKASKLKGLAVGCKVRLTEGCTVCGQKMTEPLTVTSTKPLLAEWAGWKIRVRPRHIAEVLPAV